MALRPAAILATPGAQRWAPGAAALESGRRLLPRSPGGALPVGEDGVIGLVAELVAWARRAHDARPLFATDLVVGPRFTALGAASTPGADAPAAGGIAHNGAAEMVPGFDSAVTTRELAGAVLGRPLHELVSFLATPGLPPYRSCAAAAWQPGRTESRIDIGAAALNAILNDALRANGSAGLDTAPAAGARDGYRVGDENGVALLVDFAAGRRFAAVGHIAYGARVREAAACSWALDLEPEGDALPFSAAGDVLPQADVVGIGGTALMDGTLEEALRRCRRDAYVLLVGPSTPLAPALFAHGVAALSGSIVADPPAVLGQLRVPHEGPTPRLRGMRPVTLHRH
jgi:hypothetical protein